MITKIPEWYLDSWATNHIAGQNVELSHFVPSVSNSSTVTTVAGSKLPILGSGIVNRYVPRVHKNLMSIGKISKLWLSCVI